MIGLVDHDDKTSGPKIRFINLEQPGWKARFLDLASLGGLVGGRFKYCIVLLYRKLRYDICVFMRMESLQCLVVFRYNPPHVCFFQNLGFATNERSGDASGEGGLR